MPLPRTEPPTTGDERVMLAAFLDFHRDTLALKCEGLADWQLRLRAVEPSALSLLGLVRHATDVELNWFERTLAGRATPFHYWDEAKPDTDPAFEAVDHADIAASVALWQVQVAISREISAELPLDATGTRHGEAFSHRWVLLHMIEEYSRHNGHADLLRERLDGSTGE